MWLRWCYSPTRLTFTRGEQHLGGPRGLANGLMQTASLQPHFEVHRRVPVRVHPVVPDAGAGIRRAERPVPPAVQLDVTIAEEGQVTALCLGLANPDQAPAAEHLVRRAGQR